MPIISMFYQVDTLFGAVTCPHDQGTAPDTLLAEMIPVANPPIEPGEAGAPETARP